METKFFFFLFLFANFFIQTNAQQDTSLIELTTDTVVISDIIKPEKKHNPTTAIIFSAILPGAGQGYNNQYWKIPLFYSALGTTAFSFNYFNKQYQKYLDGLVERQKLTNGEITESELTIFTLEIDETTITQYKDKYRRNRDLSALVFLAVYALNIIDATVYAHLADFDVSDDLSLTIQPEVIPLYTIKNKNTVGLTFRLRF
ncbi:MAG: DUF5683 domain-containing protein [Bacteroidales bacterium]|nr:DUF5683 domain-containing protein [Bacteroidales bacterium]